MTVTVTFGGRRASKLQGQDHGIGQPRGRDRCPVEDLYGGPGWNRTSTAFAAVLQTVRLTNAQPTHTRPPKRSEADGYGTRSDGLPDIMAPWRAAMPDMCSWSWSASTSSTTWIGGSPPPRPPWCRRSST